MFQFRSISVALITTTSLLSLQLATPTRTEASKKAFHLRREAQYGISLFTYPTSTQLRNPTKPTTVIGGSSSDLTEEAAASDENNSPDDAESAILGSELRNLKRRRRCNRKCKATRKKCRRKCNARWRRIKREKLRRKRVKGCTKRCIKIQKKKQQKPGGTTDRAQPTVPSPISTPPVRLTFTLTTLLTSCPFYFFITDTNI